jgi:indolepyruvate ferredoxin oxidoreductase alpha subunit
MQTKVLTGSQALAWGALHSGISHVSAYPGSPATATVDTLIDLAKNHHLYIEWSASEKVAIEQAIGISIAGLRTLVCVKSVGMNAIIDPLMALNLTPVNGGLVILLGDDPGAYGSQNDQDTRNIANMLETPLMEPSSPQEAFDMIHLAYELSEQFLVPIIVRITRSFSQVKERVTIPGINLPRSGLPFGDEPLRYVPVPKNAVQKHRDLHQRLHKLSLHFDSVNFNRSITSGYKGILASGFVWAKMKDLKGVELVKDLSLFKLATLYPLPIKLISDFLASCDEVMILEENTSFVESQIRGFANFKGISVNIHGKQNGKVPSAGELYRWQIQEALMDFIPEYVTTTDFSQEEESGEYPKMHSNCGDCGYGEILDLLDKAALRENQKLLYIGDPGCLVSVADRLTAKYAMGSAISVADGINKSGTGERAVALIGDSSFFHSSIPALCNVSTNSSNILIIVLDNGSALTSGSQPHPGSKKNAMGKLKPSLEMEAIARACGIEKVQRISAENTQKLYRAFLEAIELERLEMIIISI